MEQRTWKRDEMSLDVEVRMWRPDGEEVLRCKTLDLSLGGAELETFDVAFPKHRVLEIRINQLSDCGLEKHRILGKFIRKTNNGMVVQFRKANNETIKALQCMIAKDRSMKAKFQQVKYGMAG